MKAYRGAVAYPGFTIGPAHVCRDWNDLVRTEMLSMPAIVVAPYLNERQLGTIQPQRVYGIVLEHGSIIDPMCEVLTGAPHRPSIVGCAGIFEAVKDGDLIAIDGEEGLAVHAPEGQVLEYYRQKKGSKCRREHPHVIEFLRRVGDAIRQARLYRGYRAPFDLPEDDGRLLRIARNVADAIAPTPDDDAYVRSLMEPPVKKVPILWD